MKVNPTVHCFGIPTQSGEANERDEGVALQAKHRQQERELHDGGEQELEVIMIIIRKASYPHERRSSGGKLSAELFGWSLMNA